MNITPLRNFVLVELEPEAAKPGLIEVIRAAAPTSTHARVIACGPDVREVEAGARVIVSRLQGIEIAGQLLMPEGAVLAVVPSE